MASIKDELRERTHEWNELERDANALEKEYENLEARRDKIAADTVVLEAQLNFQLPDSIVSVMLR